MGASCADECDARSAIKQSRSANVMHKCRRYQAQIKMIACNDERSDQLYKAAIAKVGEVDPGTRIAAVDRKDIPSRSRPRVCILAIAVGPVNAAH